jgi:hypothetical protein
MRLPCRPVRAVWSASPSRCGSDLSSRPASADPPPLRPTGAAAARARQTGRTTVRHEARVKPVNDDRAASVVTRRDLEERLPRSAPDALRFEPGVYVQQTAHGQGSPYVRGLTGQQTIMMFDGIRLNNSTFRQGPNQYFFTIDSRTVQKLEVLRGSASTRYGSDAMGGALLATPIDPSMQLGARSWQVTRAACSARAPPTASSAAAPSSTSPTRTSSASSAASATATSACCAPAADLLADHRAPGQGPPLRRRRRHPARHRLQGVDRRRAPGLAGPATSVRLTLAYYDYRQFDAPRTDRCPPAPRRRASA